LNSESNPGEQRLLLFGGSGAIGSSVHRKFQEEGWRIVVVGRAQQPNSTSVTWDPVSSDGHYDPSDKNRAIEALKDLGPFDAVCWAQGANLNDSIYDLDVTKHENIYRVNVLYVISSLHILLREELLRKPARLCVISSIWQNLARQSKLSYCISKNALRGFVLSAASDLGRDGHVINAVLPSVIDTPMTRENLTREQISKFESATLFGRLPTLEEVASTVYYLCESSTTAVTGQFISVDLGFSNVRVI